MNSDLNTHPHAHLTVVGLHIQQCLWHASAAWHAPFRASLHHDICVHLSQVDVYAFGVLLNEMVAKEVPFAGLPVFDIKNRVMAGERPDVPLSCPRVLQVC